MTFSFSHLIFCTLDWTGLKFLTQCPLKAGAGHNCRFIKNICCLSCTWLKSLLVATLLQHRLCIGKSFVSWHGSWSQQPGWEVQTHKNIHTAASNWHQVELLIRLLGAWLLGVYHCSHFISQHFIFQMNYKLRMVAVVLVLVGVGRLQPEWEVRFVKWKLSHKLKLAAEAKFLFIAGGLRVQRSGMPLPMGAFCSSFINNLGIKC